MRAHPTRLQPTGSGHTSIGSTTSSYAVTQLQNLALPGPLSCLSSGRGVRAHLSLTRDKTPLKSTEGVCWRSGRSMCKGVLQWNTHIPNALFAITHASLAVTFICFRYNSNRTAETAQKIFMFFVQSLQCQNFFFK
jgi:hypothetical protein